MKKYRITVFIRGCMDQYIYGHNLDSLRKRGIRLLTVRAPGDGSTYPLHLSIQEHVRQVNGNTTEWSKEIERVEYKDLPDDQLEWKLQKGGCQMIGLQDTLAATVNRPLPPSQPKFPGLPEGVQDLGFLKAVPRPVPRYVLGFLFNKPASHVVLIQKEKPDWQKGLLNGVGGKIENGETVEAAMVREFEEETGVQVEGHEWRHFCLLSGNDWVVHCYTAQNTAAFVAAKTMTGELVYQEAIDGLQRKRCISNLKWLIEMALDENYGKPATALVKY